jgi:hypothetical protein
MTVRRAETDLEGRRVPQDRSYTLRQSLQIRLVGPPYRSNLSVSGQVRQKKGGRPPPLRGTGVSSITQLLAFLARRLV